MDLALDRLVRRPTRSTGVLSVGGRPFCFVVEDPPRDRDVDGDGDIDAADVDGFKVYGQTAIPAGRYRVALEDSPKFGPDTLTILDVPGFAGIRMHSGNDETHSEGCPILGYELTGEGTIRYGTTRPAVADLKERVRVALEHGETVWITIRNRYPEAG